MKHSAWLLLPALCIATSLFAQTSDKSSDKSKEKQVAGTVCNSACVDAVNGIATCNTLCTDKSGDAVLVDDQGKLMKIANPEMAMPHMNKQVKCTVIPTEKEREDVLRILQLTETGG